MAVTVAAIRATVSISGTSKAKSDLEDVSNKIKSTSDGLLNFAKGAALAAGAAFVGIGIASTKMAADFETGMTSLVTGAGESASNLKSVSDGILKMAVDTGTSTKQLTDGMYMIESAGYHGADGLNVLKVAAEGAKVGNADLGSVANAVTTVLTDYHLKSSDATGAMNALITTVASGKTHMQDLAGSMSAVLPLASSLGISFPQVGGAMATMTNAGMSAQNASQNLANAIRSLATPNKVASSSLIEVGLSAKKVSDDLSNKGLAATIQEITDAVGKKFPQGGEAAKAALKGIMGGATGLNVALMLGNANMDTFKSNTDAISKAMNAGSKDVQGWSDVQNTFNFKLDKAKEVMETLGIKIGEKLLPTLGKLVDGFSSPAFQKFATTIGDDLATALQKSIDGISTISTKIAQFVDYLNKNQGAMDTAKVVILGLAGAIGGALVFSLYNAAIAGWAALAPWLVAAAPFIAIGAIVGLVVGGIILVVQHWGEISKWLQDRWKDVSAFFAGLWKDIQGFFGNVGQWFHDRFNEAKDNITKAFGGIGKWFEDRWKDIQNVFAGIGKWFGDRWHDIQNVFAGIGKWFSDRWNEIYTPLKPVIDFIAEVFQTLWNIIVAVMGKIGKWFQDRWNEVVAVFTPIGKWFQERFNEAWQNIVKIFTSIGQWFGDRWKDIQNVFAPVGGWFHDRFTEAHNGIQTAWGNTTNWFQDRWKDIQNVFAPVGGWFHDRFTEAWNKIVDAFNSIGKWFGDRWTDVQNGINTFKNGVVDKFNELKTDASNVFKGMINGIIDQLNNGIGAVEGFINDIGQGLDGIAKALGTTGTIEVVHLGRIPHYATGTDSHPGGPAIVGEQGRELVFLPQGAKVAPNHITEMLLSMSGGQIPGYASGIGDIASNIMKWVAGGAKSVIDNLVSSLHIAAPNLGGMTSIASGLFKKVEDWAVSWVSKILPSFSSSSGPGGTPVNIPGDLQSWITQAIAATGAPANWAADIGVIAMHESGGNPNAINNWDINAQEGHPSQGIMQTIPSTFAAYALPGHGNILNPVDNIIAGIRYIMSRYGSVFNVPGIASLAGGGSYIGYANGGTVDADGTYMVGERGPEAVYLPRGANVISNSQLRSAPQPVTIVVNIAGRNVAEAILPDITQAIRYSVGTHGM